MLVLRSLVTAFTSTYGRGFPTDKATSTDRTGITSLSKCHALPVLQPHRRPPAHRLRTVDPPERALHFDGELIDLTHPFDEETIFWPTAEGFEVDTTFQGYTDAGFYYEAFAFCAAEHGGTHLDAREAEHGAIPDGSIALLKTAYGQLWPDREEYMGTAERGEEAVAVVP